MISQRAFNLTQHTAAYATVTDNYDGTQVMSDLAQFFSTFRIQDFLPLATRPDHSREFA